MISISLIAQLGVFFSSYYKDEILKNGEITFESKRLKSVDECIFDINFKIKNISTRSGKSFSQSLTTTIECIYLYIKNTELHLEKYIGKILPKEFNTGRNKSIANSYLITLIRYITFGNKYDLNVDSDELLKFIKLNTSQEDYLYLSTLIGKNNINNPEYMKIILNNVINNRYNSCLKYKNELILTNSIKTHRYIFIGNKKYKVIGIKNGKFNDEILCINCFTNEFEPLLYSSVIDRLKETYEYFNLNEIDKLIYEKYVSLKTIDIKYCIKDGFEPAEKIESNSNIQKIDYTELLSASPETTSLFLNKEKHGKQYIIKVKFRGDIVRGFEKMKEKGIIEFLNYSDNYKEFKALCEEYKQSAF